MADTAPSSSDPLPPKAALVQEEHAQEKAQAPGVSQHDTTETDKDHYQAHPGVPATGAKDMIDVPVHLDSQDLSSSEGEGESGSGGVSGALGAVKGKLAKAKRLRGDKPTAIGKVKVLRMTREDYRKYWAKDDNGNYCGTEQEGEGRRLWAEELKSA
jgi:hypothetical protein